MSHAEGCELTPDSDAQWTGVERTGGPEMRVIGVIDLRNGRAVHARAATGDGSVAAAEAARRAYQRIDTALGRHVRGDARALAGAYVDLLDLTEIYVADLDAILDGVPPSVLVEQIAGLGVPLWLDAAVSSVGSALHAVELGASQLIVGLETLDSFRTLEAICAAVGRRRVAFSLDLRGGQAMVRAGSSIAPDAPETIAARAAAAGATSVIILDLARVGQDSGVDLELVQRVRHAVPGVTLLAGGGVRNADDLRRLKASGCDAALVATALHDGRITAADVAALRGANHGNVAR